MPRKATWMAAMEPIKSVGPALPAAAYCTSAFEKRISSSLYTIGREFASHSQSPSDTVR